MTREPFSVLTEGGVGAEGRECTALVCSDQLLESQRPFQGAVRGGVGASGAPSSGGRGSGDAGVTQTAGRAGLVDGCQKIDFLKPSQWGGQAGPGEPRAGTGRGSVPSR